MKNWVILFVRYKYEKKVLEYLKKRLDCNKYQPFLPLRESARKTGGLFFKRHDLLFPNYVFIKTNIAPDLIAESLNPVLLDKAAHSEIEKHNIFKLLYYGKNKKNVVLREKERIYWENLLDSNFCIQSSGGVIKNGEIIITAGPLVGLEGKIKHINRHKREALVEMEFMGRPTAMKFMLEIAEKT